MITKTYVIEPYNGHPAWVPHPKKTVFNKFVPSGRATSQVEFDTPVTRRAMKTASEAKIFIQCVHVITHSYGLAAKQSHNFVAEQTLSVQFMSEEDRIKFEKLWEEDDVMLKLSEQDTSSFMQTTAH